jgi:hypothetical protein
MKKAVPSNASPIVAGLTVTRLVHEHFPLNKADDYGDGISIGQHVDRFIETSLDECASIHEVKIEFDPTQWEGMLKEFHEARNARSIRA